MQSSTPTVSPEGRQCGGFGARSFECAGPQLFVGYSSIEYSEMVLQRIERNTSCPTLVLSSLVLFQNYRFLDLLQVLCVCDGVAIPNNQSYIVKHWLKSYKVYMLQSDIEIRHYM
jgi:hypothetical protein